MDGFEYIVVVFYCFWDGVVGSVVFVWYDLKIIWNVVLCVC